jgi:hypothetical protein
MRRLAVLLGVLACPIVPAAVASLGASDPLPDPPGFIQAALRRVREDPFVRRQYSYTVHETESKLDSNGVATDTTESVYEIYPRVDGLPGYRRVIVRDGVPVGRRELEESDRRHQELVAEKTRELSRESPEERANRLRKQAERVHEWNDLVDEVYGLYDIRMLGREWLNGRPAIVFAFSPRSGGVAKTREGAMLQKCAGKAWVDEQEFEPTRVQVTAIDDFSMGFGLLTRIYRGSTALIERHKVNNEAWLPVRIEYSAHGRMLLKWLGFRVVSNFSDYRHYSAAGSTAVRSARQP